MGGILINLKGTENTYKSCSSVNWFGLVEDVTFSTKTGLALPNPQYLKVHRAICRIGWLSGACRLKASLEEAEEDEEYEEG